MDSKNQYVVDYYKKTGKIPKLSIFSFEDAFKTAMKLPPERALAWLKARGRNLKLSINWDDLDREAHDQAFTIAKVMNADMLQLIYDHVEKAKEEGWPLSEFREKLTFKLETSGWTGLAPSRLKVIYDTNMQLSFSKGKYRQQKLISDIYPFWKYTQIERPTKRHDHSLLHNKVFRHDDPIWDMIYPPSDFGCKCTVTPVKDGSLVEDGKDYLERLKGSREFDISPVKVWKPDAEKYVSGIKEKLREMLSK